MRKAGYHILVPYQKTPWVIHDSSFAKLNHYDENRKIALETYPDFFTEEDGFSFVYEEEWENLSEALADEVRLSLIHILVPYIKIKGLEILRMLQALVFTREKKMCIRDRASGHMG